MSWKYGKVIDTRKRYISATGYGHLDKYLNDLVLCTRKYYKDGLITRTVELSLDDIENLIERVFNEEGCSLETLKEIELLIKERIVK